MNRKKGIKKEKGKEKEKGKKYKRKEEECRNFQIFQERQKET